MKAIIQRVISASVHIKDKDSRSIEKGLLVLFGVGENDTEIDIDHFIEKVLNAKLFEGESGHFTFSVKDLKLEILLVSQYTLFGCIAIDNTIQITGAGKINKSKKLYDYTCNIFSKKIGIKLKSGEFGAYMNIISNNDGPVTLIV